MARPTLIRAHPNELIFDVQGGRLDEIRMKLENLTLNRVGFKLFSDQSDLYVFQPKSGFVDKNGQAEVLVKLLRAPDQQAAALDHVTVVKARLARNDEIDREKEWKTATPEDEAKMQVIALKSRFAVDKPVDDGVLEALLRLEKKLDDRLNRMTNMLRFIAFTAVIAVLFGLFT